MGKASNDRRSLLPEIPAKLSFAQEKVPLEEQWVLEALEYELIKNMHWHSNVLILLKRKEKYFPIIEKILKEEGVPDDFKYLSVAESGLDATIVSPAKAKGYWQFITETGRIHGLEINEEVDERSHLEKSTRAACKFLKELKDSTGSWTLAAASYNTGWGNVKKAQKEQLSAQKDNYFELHLHPETQRYIFRILAFKLILNRPEKYHFPWNPKDGYRFPSYEVKTLQTPVEDLDAQAKKWGITYKTLRQHNPWILTNKLTTPNKSYALKIPE